MASLLICVEAIDSTFTTPYTYRLFDTSIYRYTSIDVEVDLHVLLYSLIAECLVACILYSSLHVLGGSVLIMNQMSCSYTYSTTASCTAISDRDDIIASAGIFTGTHNFL